MTTYTIKADKFNGVDTVAGLIDLANDISKVLPDISFKPRSINTWGIDKAVYPSGLCEALNVFHNSDINNHIGVLDVSNYYRESDKPKYGITSSNIVDGRQTYGGEGSHKYSIHPKNIVRIAKKSFKPFTFEQIANRSKTNFKNKISSIGNSMRWEVRQKTCDGYEHLMADFENLFHLGYTPQNDKFKQMMEYVVSNKTKIDKYLNYDPSHYFVLVKQDSVQYCLNTDHTNVITVANKELLPDDIKGKLFVLDITEKQDFVEDVGLKENDGAYWIIA